MDPFHLGRTRPVKGPFKYLGCGPNGQMELSNLFFLGRPTLTELPLVDVNFFYIFLYVLF